MKIKYIIVIIGIALILSVMAPESEAAVTRTTKILFGRTAVNTWMVGYNWRGTGWVGERTLSWAGANQDRVQIKIENVVGRKADFKAHVEMRQPNTPSNFVTTDPYNRTSLDFNPNAWSVGWADRFDSGSITMTYVTGIALEGNTTLGYSGGVHTPWTFAISGPGTFALTDPMSVGIGIQFDIKEDIPELPPGAMQMMFLMFGSALTWIKMRMR